MALNSSGPISIGGSTTGQSINLELGKSATAQSSLNDTDLRALAGVSSGTISLSNFYGKSNQYIIETSLRFNAPDTPSLTRGVSILPTSEGTWTFSCWVKRAICKPHPNTINDTIFSAHRFGYPVQLYFNNEDKLRFYDNGVDLYSQGLLRDTSAWYHIVIKRTPTRNDMYINGVLNNYVTHSSSNSYGNMTGGTQALGMLYFVGGSTGYHGNLYIADAHFIDGQAKTPTDFGETVDHVWVPKEYTGTFGNNGWHCKFNNNSSASNLGLDSSGNGNNFGVSGISVASGANNDMCKDSPSNSNGSADTGVGGQVISNYCVLNRNDMHNSMAITNGSLDVQGQSSSWAKIKGTMAMSSGKWYWEYFCNGNNKHVVGIGPLDMQWDGYLGQDSSSSPTSYGYAAVDGKKYSGGSQTSYGSTWGNGDTIGIAFDADNGTLTFYRNGTSQGTAFTGLNNGPYLPVVSLYTTSSSGRINFGQYPFSYTAPSGYKCLCTENMPGGSVLGIEHHDTVLWDGTGSAKTISGFEFSPDLIICNGRQTNYDLPVIDTVRGANRTLFTFTSRASESTSSNYVTGFTSDGFTVGSDTALNENNKEQMAWCWSAGDSNATNTSGSITSTVRANTTAGFSIVSYTGNGTTNSTIGHGLGAKPAWMIVKNRSDNYAHWQIYHHRMIADTNYNAAGHATQWNEPNGWHETDNYWKRVMPTSSVFTVGSHEDVNRNNHNYIAYCWAEIEGYSRFGFYKGNAQSEESPFIYTGFRPAWIWIKSQQNGDYGGVVDTARSDIYHNTTVGNPMNEWTRQGSSGVTKDINNNFVDGLSNGFKIKSTSNPINTNGRKYIYAAFAELPFNVSRAR